MKRLLPPVVVLVGFWFFIWLFRLSQGSEKPAKGPPPMPTMAEIEARAKAFHYEIGKYGGTLNDWISSELKDLNYAISTDATTSSVLGGHVFEALLTRDPITLDWEPMLAESVPERSDDEEGLIYTVKLRHDVQWHDGHPFTADDVVFTFNEIALNESIPCPARPTLQREIKDESGKPTVRNVKIEKVDDYTVRFVLPEKYALYQGIIAAVAIFPKHILKARVDDGTFSSTWNVSTPPSQVIGTGPYRPSEYVSGERFVEKRNPNYWQKDEVGNRLPYVETLVFNIIQNTDTQKARFLAGELDYYEARALDLKELLAKSEQGNFDVVIGAPRAGWSYISFNQNPRKRPDGKPYVSPWKSALFRDVRFRQAAAHCVDKNGIIESIMDGIGRPVWGPVSPKFSKYFTDEVPKFTFDIAAANALLDEMGLSRRDTDGIRLDKEGHRIEIVFSGVANDDVLKRIVTIISHDFHLAGIKVIAEYLEFNLLVRRLNSDWDWEVILLGFTGGPEPLTGKQIWKSSEPRRLWNPRSPAGSAENRPWELRINQIFDQAYTAWDSKEHRFIPEKDVELAHEWQRICAENLPHIYLWSRPDIYGVSRRMKNRLTSAHQLYDIRRIYIER